MAVMSKAPAKRGLRPVLLELAAPDLVHVMSKAPAKRRVGPVLTGYAMNTKKRNQ
jgi:hypothetical protein